MEQPVILVAEDEPIIAFDLCESFEAAGYAIEGPFEDISSAMLAFQKHKPDLAVLDVQLGDGNVFSLAEQLLAEDVPVIFHSGHFAAKEVKERFPLAKALSKPCPPATMIESVQQVLETH